MYWENPQVSAPDPNVPAANAYHAHNMRLPIEEFLMDIHPVTTAEYAAYLRETGYTPVDTYNWLKNWGGQRCGTPTASPPLRPWSLFCRQIASLLLTDSLHFHLNDRAAACRDRTPPASIARKPVTYIGYKEAQAYCAHRNKRLPHDWEFQYAGQGSDGRIFPWGNQNCSACFPKQVVGTKIPGAPDVGAFSPKGDSPFGVADMVGG